MARATRRMCNRCRRVIEPGRCAHCDMERGPRQQRGYGADYERAQRDPAYANATHCANCKRAFTDDNPKTAGHVTAIRRGGGDGSITPTCQDCNYGWRSTGL